MTSADFAQVKKVLRSCEMEHANKCGYFAGYGGFPFKKAISDGKNWVDHHGRGFSKAYAEGYYKGRHDRILDRLTGT